MDYNSPDIRQIWSKMHRIGRFRGYGTLKIFVLYILREGPKNGAELMDTIELMSHGHWKPSPGSMYPLLSKAVDEGFIQKREDRRYELTATGYEEINLFSAEPQSHPISVEAILKEIESNLSYLEDLPGEKIASNYESLQKIELKLKRLIESVEEGMQNGSNDTGQGSDKNL